ncbi:copper resistance CopC family protein [Glycomyces sp. NRRL B-16210]|uniref:copper resistance CopC family protein n=1 Tax=Glycomyces sp. NRRL B-16210 TaxID=1463821 RepID=UPI00068EFEAA|nr:copper resistance CopC family protein [Glycomyces sp. NRRL B-16210]
MQRISIKRAFALLIAAAGGGLLAIASAAPASAHAGVVGTDPENGATLAEAPAAVTVTFSEILDGPSTEIAVTDPSGAVVAVEDASFDGDTFTQPMLYTEPGEYTVAFRLISEDGHRVDDALTFTVEAIPEDLAAAGAEAPETEAETADEATSEAEAPESTEEATTEAAEEDSNTFAALAAILLGVLVVVVGGVVLVKTLGRKQNDTTEDDEKDGGAE